MSCYIRFINHTHYQFVLGVDMSKKDEKSPYGDKSVEDVLKVESGHYYVQLGHEILESETGKLAFTKERAERLAKEAIGALNHLKKHGTDKEKQEAVYCLENFRIFPLRIH